MNIIDFCTAIKAGKVRITDHATEEALADELGYDEIFYSVLNGEILKEYHDDKPYPSCLIFGKNFLGAPIHSVWAYNPVNGWVVLITVYRPDADRWIDWRQRRKQ